MYEQAVRAAQGYRPGQEAVWGVWPTATFPGMITADSQVLYVDPNHPLAVDDGNTGQDPTSPFLTIQAALAWTRDNRGDVVLVGANAGWQYYSAADQLAQPAIVETVTVTTHGVSIVGVGPSPLGTSWHAVASGDFCLTVYAMDVHVEGFAFVGVNSGLAVNNGIYAEWDGTTILGDNLVVNRCFFDQNIDIAIQMDDVYNAEICNCRFQECEVVGIYCDPASAPCSYCSIHDNHFQDVGIAGGAAIGAISFNECHRNEIFHNRIYNVNAQSVALATDEGIDTVNGGRNLVCDNVFSCALPAGANGDIDDLCSGSATDSWIGNHCSNGLLVTIPT